MSGLYIYEDEHYESLFPLTFCRPACTLLMGGQDNVSRFQSYFPNVTAGIHCRPHLRMLLKELYPGRGINEVNLGSPGLFLNGRLVLNGYVYGVVLSVLQENEDALITYRGHVLALYLRGDNLTMIREVLSKVPGSADLLRLFRQGCVVKELTQDVMLLNYPWDVISKSLFCISEPSHNYKLGFLKGTVGFFISMKNEKNIFIDREAVIEDFVVINAEKGPVYIEGQVRVRSHSYLEGPLFIGSGTTILGGNIKRSVIGKHCKVYGELDGVILESFSNKAHEGFLGNSWVGNWVNIGAGTTTSTLKNNYTPVVALLSGEKIKTGQLFLGSFFGDHVKTGILTMLNPGTMIGFGSMIVGAGYHQKWVPPFSWGSMGNYTRVLLDPLLDTMTAVMERRGYLLGDSLREVTRLLYHYEKYTHGHD